MQRSFRLILHPLKVLLRILCHDIIHQAPPLDHVIPSHMMNDCQPWSEVCPPFVMFSSRPFGA